MLRSTKNTKRKDVDSRNLGKSTEGVKAGESTTNGSQSKKQPLKPSNIQQNPETHLDSAALFAAIAKRKGEAVKDKTAVNDDSGSEQFSTVSSGDEPVVKQLKIEFVNQPEIETPDEVLSPASSSSINFRNIDIMNMLKTINDKIDNIGKRQEKCVILAAQANAKIDSLTQRSQQSQIEPEKTAELKLIPVNSLVDLEAAEDLCKDEDYVENVIRQMGQIHGNNRFKSKGGTVCHQMIDYFVDRRFFCICSWTGISKTLDENQELVPKIAFSRYEKYINLFYKVIRNADDTFTKDECDKFLKLCMRNSKQRANELMLRQPASRNRPKKLPDGFGSNDDHNGETINHDEDCNAEYIEEIIEQDQGGSSEIEYIE